MIGSQITIVSNCPKQKCHIPLDSSLRMSLLKKHVMAVDDDSNNIMKRYNDVLITRSMPCK